MEHLALEVFNLSGTGSQFANLPDDAAITITVTSQVFGTGSVWSHSFKLNISANVHLFGSAGEIHGAYLHDQLDGRRARLWVEGIPMYYGYLRLSDEVDVDDDGNVDVSFEGGQKTFDDMLEGMSARDVSVGDVEIGVAINRKRSLQISSTTPMKYTLEGLIPLVANSTDANLKELATQTFEWNVLSSAVTTWRTMLWPKFVLSHGYVRSDPSDSLGELRDWTNVQTPYDAAHPFCNINICYPFKSWSADGAEQSGRGYILRAGHSDPTDIPWDLTDVQGGGDGQTRYNNAPNFYLLYWIDRLFNDLGVTVTENQAKDVEDLRRVFLLNFGCHYEEIDTDINVESSATPSDKLDRYGQYYVMLSASNNRTYRDHDDRGKVLAHHVTIKRGDEIIFSSDSVPGTVSDMGNYRLNNSGQWILAPNHSAVPSQFLMLSAYKAYATSENYPNVDAKEIISSMESAFGVRFIFSNDYKRVRIVLLRNLFRSHEIQELHADVISSTKQENSIRGFRLTYGGDDEDTSYNFKDWKDPILTNSYDTIRQAGAQAFNKKLYITPNNGNAYRVKIDEEEDLLFPSPFEVGAFNPAEDGDCKGEDDTIEEVAISAKPVVMNAVRDAYAVLFTGDMKAPTSPYTPNTPMSEVAAQAYLKTVHVSHTYKEDLSIQADLDVFIKEGYALRMADNYDLSGDGTSPLDSADPGLMFGVMRSSGSDSYIQYLLDTLDGEGNDWWEAIAGSGAIDHPDTCDPYGKLWDYNGGEFIMGGAAAATAALVTLSRLFGDSNALFLSDGYINGAGIFYLYDDNGVRHRALLVTSYTNRRMMYPMDYYTYPDYLSGHSVSDMLALDASGTGGLRNLIVEIDSSEERCNTLIELCRRAFGPVTDDMYIDNGVGSQYGRFSLKLRAEKPNAAFDPSLPEDDTNRRYLSITNPNLRHRGLADQFYKEYSHWIRHGRIAKMPVHLGIAELSTLDDTVKVHVGDVIGFIKKMQYSVSKKSGLGMTEMDVLYI